MDVFDLPPPPPPISMMSDNGGNNNNNGNDLILPLPEPPIPLWNESDGTELIPEIDPTVRLNAIIKIQSTWRAYQERRLYRLYLKAIIVVQKVFRGFIARKLYKKLYDESRWLREAPPPSTPSLTVIKKARGGAGRGRPTRGVKVATKEIENCSSNNNEEDGENGESTNGEESTSTLTAPKLVMVGSGMVMPKFDPSAIMLKSRSPLSKERHSIASFDTLLNNNNSTPSEGSSSEPNSPFALRKTALKQSSNDQPPPPPITNSFSPSNLRKTVVNNEAKQLPIPVDVDVSPKFGLKKSNSLFLPNKPLSSSDGNLPPPPFINNSNNSTGFNEIGDVSLPPPPTFDLPPPTSSQIKPNIPPPLTFSGGSIHKAPPVDFTSKPSNLPPPMDLPPPINFSTKPTTPSNLPPPMDLPPPINFSTKPVAHSNLPPPPTTIGINNLPPPINFSTKPVAPSNLPPLTIGGINKIPPTILKSSASSGNLPLPPTISMVKQPSNSNLNPLPPPPTIPTTNLPPINLPPPIIGQLPPPITNLPHPISNLPPPINLPIIGQLPPPITNLPPPINMPITPGFNKAPIKLPSQSNLNNNVNVGIPIATNSGGINLNNLPFPITITGGGGNSSNNLATSRVLKSGWQVYSTQEGKKYYCNRSLNITTWNENEAYDTISSNLVIPPYNGIPQQLPPPIVTSNIDTDHWEELVTNEGRKYYYNRALKVTRWDKPQSFGVSETTNSTIHTPNQSSIQQPSQSSSIPQQQKQTIPSINPDDKKKVGGILSLFLKKRPNKNDLVKKNILVDDGTTTVSVSSHSTSSSGKSSKSKKK